METNKAQWRAHEVVERTLPNGSNVYVYPTEKFKTITVKLVLRRPIGDDVTKTAMLPFVLRRGTERFPTRQAIEQQLERLYGAGLGVDVLKIGETHGLEVTLHLVNDKFLPADSDARQLAAAFQMVGQVLSHPVREGNAFKSAYVEQERQTLRRRIEGLINNKRQYAAVRLFQEMYEGEPFAIYRYGRVRDLDRIDPAGLYEHFRAVLETSLCDIFVVGAVDPDDVVQEAAGQLDFRRSAALPDGYAAGAASGPSPAGRADAGGEPRVKVEEQDVAQGVLALGFRTGGLGYADDAYPALLMYNGILGGFPHSKLFVNVRERASLAYFASSRLDSTMGAIMATAGIDVSNYDRAVDIMRRQMEAMRSGDITTEELEATRKGLISGYRTTEDRPRRMIDSRIVGLVNGRIRSIEQLLDEISTVTVDEIVAVAERVTLDTVYFLRDRTGSGSGRASSGAGRNSEEES